MSAWLQSVAGGVALTVHVQPGAKRSEIAGEHGDALKIRLAAPAVEGKANAALCDFVAELFGLRKAQVTLISGPRSRSKRVAVAGLTLEAAQHTLAAYCCKQL